MSLDRVVLFVAVRVGKNPDPAGSRQDGPYLVTEASMHAGEGDRH